MIFDGFVAASRKALSTVSLALVSFTALVPAAQAHLLVGNCELQGEEVVCKGGYSNGSNAPGTPIEVLDYDDKILHSSSLDERSEFRFAKPDGDFYVFINAGVGHTVELDKSDIKGL